MDSYDSRLSSETVAHMESAYQFYLNLVDRDGFYLHSSVVVRDGRAYLFSGPCALGNPHIHVYGRRILAKLCT